LTKVSIDVSVNEAYPNSKLCPRGGVGSRNRSCINIAAGRGHLCFTYTSCFFL